jgi:hypothetical protein
MRKITRGRPARDRLLASLRGLLLPVFLCAIGVLGSAEACLCSRGTLTVGARAAGMGGIGVVGGGSSPFKVAACPMAGLILEVSWANPYGVTGLDVGSLGMRYGWARASSAVSVGLLQTPTPFRELHLGGSMSAKAAEGIVLGGGATLASLRDDGGVFANESTVAFGAVFTARGGRLLYGALAFPRSMGWVLFWRRSVGAAGSRESSGVRSSGRE